MKAVVAQRCFAFFKRFAQSVLLVPALQVFVEALEPGKRDRLRIGLFLSRGLLRRGLFYCCHSVSFDKKSFWSVLFCRLCIPVGADSNGSRIKIPVAFFDGGVICAGRFFRSREISKVNLSFDSVFPHLQLSGVQVAPFV